MNDGDYSGQDSVVLKSKLSRVLKPSAREIILEKVHELNSSNPPSAVSHEEFKIPPKLQRPLAMPKNLELNQLQLESTRLPQIHNLQPASPSPSGSAMKESTKSLNQKWLKMKVHTKSISILKSNY